MYITTSFPNHYSLLFAGCRLSVDVYFYLLQCCLSPKHFCAVGQQMRMRAGQPCIEPGRLAAHGPQKEPMLIYAQTGNKLLWGRARRWAVYGTRCSHTTRMRIRAPAGGLTGRIQARSGTQWATPSTPTVSSGTLSGGSSCEACSRTCPGITPLSCMSRFSLTQSTSGNCRVEAQELGSAHELASYCRGAERSGWRKHSMAGRGLQ